MRRCFRERWRWIPSSGNSRFFRQFAQEVAVLVSDCYAECQALGLGSESDC